MKIVSLIITFVVCSLSGYSQVHDDTKIGPASSRNPVPANHTQKPEIARPTTASARADHYLAGLNKELQLSDAQYKKMYQVVLEFETKYVDAKKIKASKRKEAIATYTQERNKKFKTILTKEQFKKFENWRVF